MIRSNLYVNPNCKNYEDTFRELKLGYLNVKEEMYDLAQTNFDLVIIADKTCADAFWGLMLCKLQVNDENVFVAEPDKYTSVFRLKEYQNAMKYATKEQKATYTNFIKDIPGYEMTAGYDDEYAEDNKKQPNGFQFDDDDDIF